MDASSVAIVRTLSVLVLCTYIQLQSSKPSRKPTRALSSDEIKLSDLYDKQSGIYFEPVFVDMPALPRFDTAGELIRVAILDTGILHAHPSLKNIRVVDKDFTGEGAEDQNGHGTVMTLLYLEVTRSLTNQEILNVKVLGKDGAGYVEDIEKGMQWAVDNGADILNMSLGVPKSEYPELCALASRLNKEKGARIFAAAGNDPGVPMCPASAEGVISVGADNRKAPMEPTVFAPGTNTFKPTASPPLGNRKITCDLNGWKAVYQSALTQGSFEDIAGVIKGCPEEADEIFDQLTSDSSAAYMVNNCDQTLKIAGASFQIAADRQDVKHEVIALNQLGVGFRCRGDLSKTSMVLKRALELSKECVDKHCEETTLSNWGELQQSTGDLTGAIESLNKALDLARSPEINDEEDQATDLGNLCTAYIHLKNFTEAISSCNQALILARKQHFNFLVGRTLLNLGTICFEKQDLANARDYFQQARNTCMIDLDITCFQISQRELDKVAKKVGQDQKP
jgi:tetratricopeptide (TPR) repeat protein